MKKILYILFFTMSLTAAVSAGTVGKIKGKVVDKTTGEALVGANVLIIGTTFGAATDINGEYVISNLNADVYQVRASYVGYQSVLISNVRVNADLTTELNFELPLQGVSVGEIEVIAQKPLINKSATNANRITNSDDIEALPVRGVNQILALTPGVVLQDKTIFVRGGRQDEVGFYLEGTNITDPLYGGQAVHVVQDALEEIQVQAGGYTAEFGGANAGIIREQIKSGTPNFKASLEYVTDNIGFSGSSGRFSGDKRLGTYWYGYNEMTGTISGPVVNERLKFFGLFNYFYQTDQNPQPYPGINIGLIGDPTTGDTLNLMYPAGAIFKNSLEQYNGTGTITLDFNPILFRLAGTFTSQTTFNPFSTSRVAGNIANILDEGRVERIDGKNGAFNLKMTHILSSTTYYEINAGYSFRSSNTYDPILKDNYLGYGDSVANAQAGVVWERSPGDNTGRYQRPARLNIYGFSFSADGDAIAGYGKAHRNDLNLSAAFSTQLGKAHAIKLGGEFRQYTISNYSIANEGLMALPGLLDANARDTSASRLTREEVFINRGVNNYGYDLFGNEYSGTTDYAAGKIAPHKPVFAAAYIEDRIEYRNLIVNFGLRYDYINVDNQQLKDPTKPEDSFDKNTGAVKPEGLTDVPTFSSLSPRLGFSFPVTDQTVFHAQYGKFVQQTRLRDIYQGPFLTSSEIGGGFFIPAPVGFNVRPTRTTQYEIGFTQQIANFATFDITGFYKDIQDQVVYDQQNTGANSPYGAYSVLTNGDFATTKGVELSFNMRRTNRLQASASISFQDAQGTGSFPNSNRGIVTAPLDGVTIFKPQYVTPLEFNNSFRGNVNLDYRFGREDGPSVLQQLGGSILFSFNSGHPFTRGKGGDNLEGDARDRQPIEPLNSSTTPWNFQVDLRIDKTFSLFGSLNANIYLYVINLLDTKNIQNVFLRTGSVSDDGYLDNPSQGGKLVETLGPQYAQLYRAINLDYYEQWQYATTGAAYTTSPFFYGPPRQIRLGIRLEY